MALIKCHECEKEISDEAKQCPHCGAKPKKGMGVGKALVLTFAILVAVSMVMGKVSRESADKAEEERRAALTPQQRAAEDAAKAKTGRLNAARGACLIVLEKSLNDPDSAKFGMVSDWYTEERKNGTILVQPTARAKNAFGGYVQGVWNCVVKPDGGNVRVLSLNQIRP